MTRLDPQTVEQTFEACYDSAGDVEVAGIMMPARFSKARLADPGGGAMTYVAHVASARDGRVIQPRAVPLGDGRCMDLRWTEDEAREFYACLGLALGHARRASNPENHAQPIDAGHPDRWALSETM